jgi:hypothetical protein
MIQNVRVRMNQVRLTLKGSGAFEAVGDGQRSVRIIPEILRCPKSLMRFPVFVLTNSDDDE